MYTWLKWETRKLSLTVSVIWRYRFYQDNVFNADKHQVVGKKPLGTGRLTSV